MARVTKPTPKKVRQLFAPGTEAFKRAIRGNTAVVNFLRDAVDAARAADALERDGLPCEVAWTRCGTATIAANDLLMRDPDLRHFFGRYLEAQICCLVGGRALPGRGIESWPGLRREALLPGQRVRYEICEGRRVRVGNVASPDELRQLLPYELWEAERVSGQPANLRGKSTGDGRMSPAEFYRALEAGLAKCRSQKLRLELLAKCSGMDRKTLKRYLDDPNCGPPWRLLKRERTLAACRAAGWRQPTASI
jgi:hypothetical protein